MEKKTIEIDLYGAAVSQLLADRIHAQTVDATYGDIILRNVDFRCFPRLIVDYGEIYETLCAVAKDYRDYKALVAGHWGGEAEGVIASQLEELPRPSSSVVIYPDLSRADIWRCKHHPPGSEIEVKKGGKCFCGRGEE